MLRSKSQSSYNLRVKLGIFRDVELLNNFSETGDHVVVDVLDILDERLEICRVLLRDIANQHVNF